MQGREGFESVDKFAYVQQLQEQGALTLDAQKTGPVIARKVEQEMELEVYTKNGNLESVETAKPGEILLTRADEHGNPVIDDFGHTNTWKVSRETFEKRYDIENMREDGFANPKFAAQTFIQVDRDISIEAPWGGTQEIKAGGFLNITDPEKDLYGIAKEEFAETYMILDSKTHDHSAEEYDFNHDYAKFASEHEAYSPDKDYSNAKMLFSKNPVVQEICENMENKMQGSLSDMSKEDVLFMAIRNGDVAIEQFPMNERTANVYAAALVQEPEIYEELNEEISPMMNAEIVEVLSERPDVSRSEIEDILEHIEEYSYINQIESGLDLSDKLRDSIEAAIPETHSIDEPEHNISFSLDGDEH